MLIRKGAWDRKCIWICKAARAAAPSRYGKAAFKRWLHPCRAFKDSPRNGLRDDSVQHIMQVSEAGRNNSSLLQKLDALRRPVKTDSSYIQHPAAVRDAENRCTRAVKPS